MQSLGQCFVFALLITLCASWPEGSMDSQVDFLPFHIFISMKSIWCNHYHSFVVGYQEIIENQPSISDLEKFYSSYRVPSYFNVDDDDTSIQRLQYRFGRRTPMGTKSADFNLIPSYRQMRTMLSMMTKRVPSPRYRQCYFNPVACFRK